MPDEAPSVPSRPAGPLNVHADCTPASHPSESWQNAIARANKSNTKTAASAVGVIRNLFMGKSLFSLVRVRTFAVVKRSPRGVLRLDRQHKTGITNKGSLQVTKAR